jgi:hypothetical protein
LARISFTRPEVEIAAFCAHVADEARSLARPRDLELKPDLPDPPTLRAEILTQLALLARSQAAPSDEKVRAEILALARPAPLDARMSELGVGGNDPLGSIPAVVRFRTEGLRRAGPPAGALAARAPPRSRHRARALAPPRQQRARRRARSSPCRSVPSSYASRP